MRRRVVVAVVALAASALSAQERLRVQGPEPATVVLGNSARIDLVVEGRSGNPEAPQVPNVPGLTVQVFGPSRQSFSSITPNGVTEQVLTQYQIVLQPQREGSFAIPSFSISTGTRVQTVPAMQITAVKELRGAEFGYLEVKVEPQRVYVHEPIRARVEFGVDKSLRPVTDVARNRARYFDFEVQAAWLSTLEGAEAVPEPDPVGDTAPVVLNRTLQPAEYDSDHERGGKTYNSFVFYKSFLPTRPGKVTLDAPMLRYQVQLREGRRGLFGETIGGQTQNYYVYGQPLAIEVLPIPEAGRPKPYFGAVGRFTIAATLNKDTVKVGSSVKLLLRITGAGNFEFLRVPELSGLEQKGLHMLGQTEERKVDGVTVTYDLTPLQASVREVPPIDWNFFDTTPGVEAFAAVATPPLPLHVLPPDNPESLQPLPETTRKAVTPGVDDIFDLPALDGPPRPRPTGSPRAVWCAMLLPWLTVLGLRLVRTARRRALADPGKARGRQAARTCLRSLADGTEPIVALTGYLADRLDVAAAAVIGPELHERLVAAGLDPDASAVVVAAIEQGTAGRYGGTGGLTQERVRELVQQLESAALQRASAPGRAGAIGLAVAIGLLAPWSLRAQERPAVAAYRSGDYAAAADAFAQACERIDDRRLWFARGNCYYRLGDLPRALWAYECARLGMPRDAELLANRALLRRQLQLDGGGEGFLSAIAALRDRFTANELTVSCGVLMALAAFGLGLGGRRAALRWAGWIAMVPALLLSVELAWLRPERPPAAIALKRLELVAEPRAGMRTIAVVQPGVELQLRSGDSGDWVRVEVDGRSGYAARADLARIE